MAEYYDQSKVEERGKKWFVGAFIVSALFVMFLMKIDTGLSTSTTEKDHAMKLRSLRTAQTHLDSRVTDTRQLITSKGNILPTTNNTK